MLRVEIIGNLGSDPELRFMPSGSPILTFRVAVNSVKGKGDDRKERVDWFRVKVMGSRAEYLGQALRKGSRVLAIGRLEIDEYESKDGERRQSWDIWGDDVVNLTPRDRAEGGEQEYAPQGRGEAAVSTAGAGARRPSRDEAAGASDLEDLPF